MTKLTAMKVEKLTEEGSHADGSGLYLHLDTSGKRWFFRYTEPLGNKRRAKISLGAYDKRSNTLADARDTAAEYRKLVRNGIDPKVERERLKQEAELRKLKEMKELQKGTLTFEVVARDWYERNKGQWSNLKHRQQSINTLETYVFPFIGSKGVDDVTLEDVRLCLDPIWSTKTETAKRVRMRMNGVFNYAIASGFREKANPAVWKGLLSTIYPAPEKLKQQKHLEEGSDGHHKALPYGDVVAFYKALAQKKGIGAVALRFLILTASRTKPVRYAKWEEFDLDKKVWTVPAKNMKDRKEFKCALSDDAVELLEGMERLDDFVFVGGSLQSLGKPLSDAGMSSVLKRMDVSNATVHGFRSTFRDYIGEETDLDYRLAEMALAHTIGSQSERAYARGDLLKKRFSMMNIWADYLRGA